MSELNLEKIKLNIFGRSHGDHIGFELEGIPSGHRIDFDRLADYCRRRRPSDAVYSTARKESDTPVFVSGFNGNVTDGNTIRAVIANENAISSDYDVIKDVPRPSHADYTAYVKYGKDRDYRGGGEFSGRMTAPLCIAGGICAQILESMSVKIISHLASVGEINDDPFDLTNPLCSLPLRDTLPVSLETAEQKILAVIKEAAEKGDSIGGVIETAVVGVPAGIGGPGFESLEGKISNALFGIPAVHGVEFGKGFKLAEMNGSSANDPFIISDGQIKTSTNNSGGINGGISNGMPIIFRAAMRPTPSISIEQNSVSLSTLESRKLSLKGRHDPCLAVRALPAIESATALVILDSLLSEQKGEDTLASLRGEIDEIDSGLCKLFAKRMEVSKKIAAVKRKEGISVTDKSRETTVKERVASRLGENLAPYGEELWDKLFELSKRAQKAALTDTEKDKND
ncbi:MAG: chorismate synthase [Clostridia bacterium]|nr:chorismate synthase [Clostridia bacterium]